MLDAKIVVNDSFKNCTVFTCGGKFVARDHGHRSFNVSRMLRCCAATFRHLLSRRDGCGDSVLTLHSLPNIQASWSRQRRHLCADALSHRIFAIFPSQHCFAALHNAILEWLDRTVANMYEPIGHRPSSWWNRVQRTPLLRPLLKPSSVAALVVATTVALFLAVHYLSGRSSLVECVPVGSVFHGIPQNVPYEGGPEGSCWCGHGDLYCLCTPSLSVDVVLEVVDLTGNSLGVVVTNRTKPPYGVSLTGGFVDIGESVETAAVREVMEEIGVRLQESALTQVKMFSDPKRDPRRAGATMSFYAKTSEAPSQSTGDETKDIRMIPWPSVPLLSFVFPDHRSIAQEACRFSEACDTAMWRPI